MWERKVADDPLSLGAYYYISYLEERETVEIYSVLVLWMCSDLLRLFWDSKEYWWSRVVAVQKVLAPGALPAVLSKPIWEHVRCILPHQTLQPPPTTT